MTVHSTDDIGDAVSATRSLPWPFEVGLWAKLAFVVLFVGGAGGVNPLLFVLALVAIALFVAVPVQAFLRYYALLVLGDTNEAFDLIPEQRRAIRE